MKKILLLFVIILSGILHVYAQEDFYSARDVIYPIDANLNTIRGVRIIDINEGNIVFYQRDDKIYKIEAVAIYRNGEYITLKKEYTHPTPVQESLYNNQKQNTGYETDPEYLRYQALYNGAKGRSAVGGIFTIFGIVTPVIGALMMNDRKSYNDQTEAILFLSGSLLFNIGLPLWISGGVRKRNNYNAMLKRKNELSLSIAVSNYGKRLGLKLTF